MKRNSVYKFQIGVINIIGLTNKITLSFVL